MGYDPAEETVVPVTIVMLCAAAATQWPHCLQTENIHTRHHALASLLSPSFLPALSHRSVLSCPAHGAVGGRQEKECTGHPTVRPGPVHISSKYAFRSLCRFKEPRV